MKQLSIAILFSLPMLGIGQPSDSLPNRFASFSDAMSHIYQNHCELLDDRRETIRTLEEKKNARIVSGEYYSCDNKTGYIIFIFINGDVLIYEKLPVKIWNEYKKCISTDSYYENNILTKWSCIFKQPGPDVHQKQTLYFVLFVRLSNTNGLKSGYDQAPG